MAEDYKFNDPPPPYSPDPVASSSHAVQTRPCVASVLPIGGATPPAPLVPNQLLKAHLTLLRSFKHLRTRVESNENLNFPPIVDALNPTERWAWFVGLAVDRFQRWVEHVKGEDPGRPDSWVKTEFPPLDVVMVWHTYMLNPAWYAEDCERVPLMRRLKPLGDLLLPAIASAEKGIPMATPEREQAWEARTKTKFDPIQAAAGTTHRKCACPVCGHSTRAPYLTETATGYAQSKFQVTCYNCGHWITKESLGLAKFLRDLTAARFSVLDKEPAIAMDLETYLAGTLHTHTNTKNVERAKRYKDSILGLWEFKCGPLDVSEQQWRIRLHNKLNNSVKEVPKYVATFMRSSIHGRRTFNRILSAYIDDRPFSVDLVGAVLRQGSFIDKMDCFGWLDPGAFDGEDEVVLDHALARYHAFLDLMTTSDAPLFVPTLDIDLVWHSHQLMARQYARDCKQYLNRYIDHDDKVEESYLASSLDKTCRAWQDRFGVPYMHCGCPLPGKTIGQRLRSLSAALKAKSKPVPQGLAPPQGKERFEAVLATHPSRHNLIHVNVTHCWKGKQKFEEANAKREKIMEKRRNRDEKKRVDDNGKPRMNDFNRDHSVQAQVTNLEAKRPEAETPEYADAKINSFEKAEPTVLADREEAGLMNTEKAEVYAPNSTSREAILYQRWFEHQRLYLTPVPFNRGAEEIHSARWVLARAALLTTARVSATRLAEKEEAYVAEVEVEYAEAEGIVAEVAAVEVVAAAAAAEEDVEAGKIVAHLKTCLHTSVWFFYEQ
ncbi:hypothetical protein WOLCODRAFT_157078 [Wolfiporia cocos MD-104 SS10]|uniref:Uncharacterized protein n=1 Tax=Wolfiporia cocos (strain MD-104) TaxID=742152 RepID=A0A2H3J291_WOLCO|nr:hypothetical protein WOLCODRAFT_157078 [Wolfiporia cocos MD-104 SS10]